MVFKRKKTAEGIWMKFGIMGAYTLDLYTNYFLF